ncbi:phosphotransferase family protein [Paeniglutamicibacter antarcticus]|uniref:Aminoglycoside phosphotransferase domain-containing protein n=1 Tax=Paeniglutamicibacter antarcticus TaxID=494023 RepID=A0ABP9TPZ2_9MICC
MSTEALSKARELAHALYPGPDWNAAHVEEGGQFHRVLVANGEAVMRMSRTPQAARDMQRRVDLVDSLAGEFSFRLPTSLSRVWHGEGFSAVIQRFVPGAPHRPHAGDAASLRRILDELASVDVQPLGDLLAPQFSFRGPWTTPKVAATLDALPVDLRDGTQRVLDTIASFAEVPAALVHGDLAGHNMRWSDGKLHGILDWDMAAAWDPALNTAYLGLWHGEGFIEEIAPGPDVAWRARVWLGAMSLESVFDASLDQEKDLGALVGKIGPRLAMAATAAGS